ncbi:hypothetical protein bAD24_p01710 (plasmid) [Burkholderia sp. AD24]|nr:hypothetical protein bAD24_p01710 [Burkholderia sp. AD24]
MKSVPKLAVFTILVALSGGAFAQGAGGAGAGGGGGNGNGSGGGSGGQGGTGMSMPNAGGTTGTMSSSKGTTTKPPTRMPQKDPHAKGASDTAASGAQ